MDRTDVDEAAKALAGSRRAALIRGAALVLAGMLTAFSQRTAHAVVQVVKMVGDLPSNSPLHVLASATVPDAQVKSGDVTLVANFATTRLTQSTNYAVVVSRTTSTIITERVHKGGDDCTGDLFIGDRDEGFLKPLDPVMDMIVTVLVL